MLKKEVFAQELPQRQFGLCLLITFSAESAVSVEGKEDLQIKNSFDIKATGIFKIVNSYIIYINCV